MLKTLSTWSQIYKEDFYRFIFAVPLYFFCDIFFERNCMSVTLRTKPQKLMMCFSELKSGCFALLGITWMVFDFNVILQHSCRTLTMGNAAVLRIIPIVMKTVTMKMLAVRSTQEVGANASGQVITWPVSTRATAMIFIALKNSDAVRWRKVILFYSIHN